MEFLKLKILEENDYKEIKSKLEKVKELLKENKKF